MSHDCFRASVALAVRQRPVERVLGGNNTCGWVRKELFKVEPSATQSLYHNKRPLPYLLRDVADTV